MMTEKRVAFGGALKSVTTDEIKGMASRLSDENFEVLVRLEEERDRLRMACSYLGRQGGVDSEPVVAWAAGLASAEDQKDLLDEIGRLHTKAKDGVASYLSPAEEKLLRESSLGRSVPFVIRSVSSGFFSVARYSGGAVINGYQFTYMNDTDELVREDVMLWIAKERIKVEKEIREAKRAEAESKQGVLPLGIAE